MIIGFQKLWKHFIHVGSRNIHLSSHLPKDFGDQNAQNFLPKLTNFTHNYAGSIEKSVERTYFLTCPCCINCPVWFFILSNAGLGKLTTLLPLCTGGTAEQE